MLNAPAWCARFASPPQNEGQELGPLPTLDEDPIQSVSHARELEIERITAEIRRACMSARLSPGDSDDIVQDIWLWILRNRSSFAALPAGWIHGVTRNFILRFRRASLQRTLRERAAARLSDPAPEVGDQWILKASLESIRKKSGQLDTQIMASLNLGYSFEDAAGRAGVPKGSRDFHRKRIRARLASLHLA